MASGAAGRLALTGRMRTRAHILFLVAMLTLSSPALAEELPKEKGVARTVKMFDMFCLTQLPDIEGIERFAGFGEFAQIFGDELKPFRTDPAPEKLLAWRFHDFGAELILTAERRRPDAAFKAKHPAFAKGKSATCALLIPNDGSHDDIVKELTHRLGRAPDESVSDAGTLMSAWNNETAKAVTRVVYRAPAEKAREASLTASVTVKD